MNDLIEFIVYVIFIASDNVIVSLSVTIVHLKLYPYQKSHQYIFIRAVLASKFFNTVIERLFELYH